MFKRVAMWLPVLLILQVSVPLDTLKTWAYTEKQLYPAHLIPKNALDPRRTLVRRKIVLYHNFFRSKVRPTASNMLLMSWHEGAARQAQAYAEKCIFLKHNDIRENHVPGLGTCGQNLFASSQRTPWFFALKRWFIENTLFVYGYPNYNLKEIGHYTQMVWATSHKVGCGLAYCNGGPWGKFYNYVCHYCPGGNIHNTLQYPYKTGKPCEDCRDQCVSNSLCNNPCYQRDVYSNCGQLHGISPDLCQQGVCNATCQCAGKIYKNYPWV